MEVVVNEEKEEEVNDSSVQIRFCVGKRKQ